MRTNYVTSPRPRTQAQLSDWQLVPSGVAVDSPGPDGVNGYARVTSTGATAGGIVAAVSVPGGAGNVDVYGKLTVRPSVDFTPNSLQIATYSSGALVELTSLTGAPLGANVWTEVEFHMFAAQPFDEVKLVLADDGTELVAGETLDATKAFVSLQPGAYFDGGTPNDLDINGRGEIYEWAGEAWASKSTERFGFVGILSATWDPVIGGVHLVVDGGMWPTQTVAQLTIERTSPSEGTVPVRGVEKLWAPGGGFVGTDHEMPINELIEYTVYGYDKNGNLVDQSTAVVATPASKENFYVKAPGNADLTQKPVLRGVGTIESTTRGGAYQIAGGGALAQAAGANTRAVSVTVGTSTAGEAQSLEGLLSVARVLLLQDGNENPEIPNGWWFVSSWERSNVAQLGFGAFDYRTYTLGLTATERPAGVGVRSTGNTWGALIAQNATWQDVLDNYPTWLDVVLGDAGGGV